MIKKTLIILSILAIAVIAGAFAVYAYTTWNQTTSWTTENVNFTVWDSLTSGTEIDPTIPLSLGIVKTSDSKTVNYFIQNEGNVLIRVNGATTPNVGTLTPSWTQSYVDVTDGSTRKQMTLTLTGFSVGSGSIIVSFTSATP